MRVSVKKRQIWKALDDGLTVREIAVLLDVPPKQVSYYKSRWVPKEA
jgi:DNA-binding NarL/FixJ family response regulator